MEQRGRQDVVQHGAESQGDSQVAYLSLVDLHNLNLGRGERDSYIHCSKHLREQVSVVYCQISGHASY